MIRTIATQITHVIDTVIHSRMSFANSGTSVELGNSQLVFERTLIRCTTISIRNNALSAHGIHSSHVVSNSVDSNVPIKTYPRMIPLTILDNDGK